MTALSLTLQTARLKALVWRYLVRRAARRAVLRLMRRVLDWMEPVG